MERLLYYVYRRFLTQATKRKTNSSEDPILLIDNNTTLTITDVDVLSVHLNHLNAILKRITTYSASELIYRHILSLAKSKLSNIDKSVKEIAFELYYNYPNHFAKFFMKQTGVTPVGFRKSL